jgi:hypothetical protein
MPCPRHRAPEPWWRCPPPLSHGRIHNSLANAAGVNAIQLSGQSDDALLDIIRGLFKVSQAVSPETCVYMSAADFAQVHEHD